MGGLVVAPRFDTPALAAANAAAIAFWVAALVVLVRRQRSADRPDWWAWLLMLAHFSFDGIYVPIGPLIALVSLGPRRRASWEQRQPPDPAETVSTS